MPLPARNLTATRNLTLSLVPEKYIKNAVVFEVSEIELLRRLEKREKETGIHIKRDVINNMLALYEPPREGEFDNIES